MFTSPSECMSKSCAALKAGLFQNEAVEQTQKYEEQKYNYKI